MWRFLVALALTGVIAQSMAFAQETQRPYGTFDAIAEGTARNEAQRLALIDSQLQTVNQLRLTEVAGPRALLRDPSVAAVYPYGRRGLLGLRPRGYIVVRRAPVTAYRRSYDALPAPYEYGDDPSGYSARYGVRQPIGHQLSRTGPNRWEYRPLYADDDPQFDALHRQIERELRPSGEYDRAAPAVYATDEAQTSPPVSQTDDAPEELPEPAAIEGSRSPATADRVPLRGGGARDIARDVSQNDAQRSGGRTSGIERQSDRVPPPPQPDPPGQPRNGVTAPSNQPANNDASVEVKPPAGNDEVRGPLLQNPTTGSREF